MSAELRELYRDVIVDHGKQPRNCRALGGRAWMAEAYNPLCGDKVTVYVDTVGGVLHDVTFQNLGCAISTAAASMMTEAVKGKSAAEVAQLSEAFRVLVTTGSPATSAPALGALAAFAGVRQFPSRIKCALLAWQALDAALKTDRADTQRGDVPDGRFS